MLSRETKTRDMEERYTHIILLVINGLMFLAEIFERSISRIYTTADATTGIERHGCCAL